MHLPLDFADALAQARSLGVGFVAAHQYLHQLDPAMRSAVLANAQSRMAFRLPGEDARVIAADSALTPEDFQSLGAFQCYVQRRQGAVQPWCSAAPCRQASRSATRRGPAASRRAMESIEPRWKADLHRAVVWSPSTTTMTSRHGGEARRHTMSACRVASRIALRMQRQNPRCDGVRPGSLATKVFRRLPTVIAHCWFTCALVRLRRIEVVRLTGGAAGPCGRQWGCGPLQSHWIPVGSRA